MNRTIIAVSALILFVICTSLTVIEHNKKTVPHINLTTQESRDTIAHKVTKIHELGLTVQEALQPAMRSRM